MTDDKTDNTTTPAPLIRPRRMVGWAACTVVLLAGVGGRVWLTDVSTRSGYKWDHFDNIGMGLSAAKHGLLDVYTIPSRDDLAKVPGRVFDAGQFKPYTRQAIILPNYPPLCISLFYLQAKALEAIDPPLTANTFTARLVMGSLATLAELLTAVGVFGLARMMFGTTAGLAAGALCWLMPPIAMDTSFWGQVDSFMLAPSVWLVWLLLRRRWVAAGVVLAVAALLKPQGILLGPIVLFAAVVVREGDVRASFQLAAIRAGKVVGTALTATLVITAPWMITSGGAWFDRCYVQSFAEAFPYTTLKGFNVWYVDALRMDAAGDFGMPNTREGALHSGVTIAGVRKDSWARLAILTALIATAVLAWRRYRDRPAAALTIFAAVWLWSVFIWPTRVHERFIVYSMPMVIIAAVGMRRFWPALLGLAIVGTAELSSNAWTNFGAVGRFSPGAVGHYYKHVYLPGVNSLPPSQRPPAPTREQITSQALQWYRDGNAGRRKWETLATVGSLASYAWMIVAAFYWPGVGSRGRSSAAHRTIPDEHRTRRLKSSPSQSQSHKKRRRR